MADTSAQYDDAFRGAAEAFKVDPDILKSMAHAESGFSPDVISGKRLSSTGAIGLMQFMPDTAKRYGIDPLHPEQAIFGAAKYLRDNLDKFNGDYAKAVAAYNTGENRAYFDKPDWHKSLPSETLGYVDKVLKRAHDDSVNGVTLVKAPVESPVPAVAPPVPVTPPAKALPTSGPAAIPVEPGANTTINPEKPQWWGDKVMGITKVIPSLATGVVAGAVAPVAGLAHGLFNGQYGTPQGVRDADAFAGRVSNALTYKPNNPLTEEIVGKVGNVMQNVIGIPIPTMNALGQSAPAATRAVKDATRAAVTPVTDLVTVPMAIRAAEKHAANVAKSEANAPQIDAAKKAVEMGLLLDTTVSNPGKSAKLLNAVTGQGPRQRMMAQQNEVRIQELAKEEMGLPPKARLDSSEAFEAARKNISKPYDDIAAMPALTATDDVLSQISSLRVKPVIGGKSAAGAANQVIDDAIKAISTGEFKGADAITNIRQLRADAQTILNARKSGHPITPEQAATASVNQGIADALESLVEANLKGNPKLLQEFRDARVKMAKTYAYENATDFNTGKIDTGKLADATSKNARLTGTIADIGIVAGNFPETFVAPSTKGSGIAHIYRTTPGGMLGAAIGSAISPGVGTVVGGSIGAGVGEVAGAIKAKRMMTPGYQAANAVPKDYRPPVNNLRPVEPNVTTNSVVPFDYGQSIEQPGSRPNWTYGRPDANVTASPIPPGAPQLGAPSAESTMQGVQQRRAFDYRMQKSLDEQQAAAQAAAQAATRKPASRGVQFDLDPLTGKLVPIDTTVKGATPNILMAGTSHSLDTAAGKVVSGQQYRMNAAEKVAWNKTKVDLASSAPELSSLSDVQVAQKMMDRQWVSDTIAKARQKAQAFDEIAKRANSAQAAREAVASRDRMMDFVESLQERLSAPRPTRSGVQGKKTREAQRTNNLGTARDNVNALNTD